MQANRTWGILAGLSAAAIWGGMYVVSKVVLDVIPPFILLTLRLLFGIIALGLVYLWRRPARTNRRLMLKVLGVGVLGYGISLGLQFAGTRLSTAANGAVVTSATPAFIFIFSVWLLRERVSGRRLAALLLATVGVLAVIDLGNADPSSDLFVGNLLLVGAALTWALYSVLVRLVTRQIPTLSFSIVAFIGGLFIAIPLGTWEWNTQSLGELNLAIWLGVFYLGVVSTALAAYLWNKAFEILEAGVASLTFFAQPVFGAALGVAFLGERLTPLFIFGGILIILGLWLAASET
ncbi:MAG: DMT family transporter [Chloroflexi bacterium]|nr:MAG: DMT family transporter [Chloroflexota bacterium]MBL1194082.1 DMT family transporter [Chloroflexota bacterium]NOH11376.1 DMT family transporter [Chloroflexota bacterium]